MTSRIGSGKTTVDYFNMVSLDTDYENFLKVLSSEEPDLSQFMDGMSFSGFNKARMARLAAERLGARRTIKLTVLAAFRGTNLGKIMQNSVKIDPDVRKAYDDKLILSNGKGSEDLTMGRLLACFPQFAAYYLLKYKCPKKIESSQCPSCIQFPAAASLPMSPLIRASHLAFCIDFSDLIGSKFDSRFYLAAFRGAEDVNSLNPELRVVLGDPTNEESSAVDIQATLQSLDLKGPKAGGVRI